MKLLLLIRRGSRALLPIGAAAALCCGVLIGAVATSQAAASPLPCDIYASAGTPCVSADSTVRALYQGYDGPLYQVRRSSDGHTADIGVLAPGGYANSAVQDSFCAGTQCTITRIYDQSPRHNDLTIEGRGGNGGRDHGASANALPVVVGGHRVYGLDVSGQVGYRDDNTSGVARNGQPESMYMVASGTHYNNLCCFDYGNAETNNLDNGAGHMDALNLGTWCQNAPCYGRGPWVQADTENGLYMSNQGGSLNPGYTGSNQPYVTAMLENNGQNHFALRYGNAQSGGLTVEYSGPEPNRPGYSPMQQEGAIVLGTGGDNSNGSIGSFFEGVMTAGVPAGSADDAVQADITSIGYGGTVTPPPSSPPPSSTPPSSPTPPPGSGTCRVSYTVTNQWPGGFGANVTITDTGSTPVNGWSLTWAFPNGQGISQIWNAAADVSGGQVTATNLSYNAAIPANGGSTSFGFNGTWNSANNPPSAFKLNGTTCING